MNISCDSDDILTAPEYEFDSSSETDINGWDDIDLIQENEYLFIKSSYKESNKYEECWKCIECCTINNVQISIRKYNRKCCGCQQSFYIENQTEIIYSSQWDTINDFIFKSWSCTQCTFVNHNHLSNLCEICQSPSTIITDEIRTDNISDPRHFDKNKNQITPWICTKCNGMEIQNDIKCEKCDCKKPIKQKMNFSIDLISGFCRKYFYNKIPDGIGRILNDYYKLQTFSCSLKSYLTSYYNQYAVTSLIGDQYIQYPQKNKWILQLQIDNNDVFMSDINIFDIEIGVIDDNKKTYTIKGNGRNNNYQYPSFNKCDVITVELDCECGTLSFGINNNWYGIQCDDLSLTTRYRLYLLIKQEGVIIHLID